MSKREEYCEKCKKFCEVELIVERKGLVCKECDGLVEDLLEKYIERIKSFKRR